MLETLYRIVISRPALGAVDVLIEEASKSGGLISIRVKLDAASTLLALSYSKMSSSLSDETIM